MESMQETMDTSVDASQWVNIRDEIAQATVAMMEYEEAQRQVSDPPTSSVPQSSDYAWQSDPTQVFTGSGIERWNQEISSANSMLKSLNDMQLNISATAAQTNIFPTQMNTDISIMSNRLLAVQQRIQNIENNPLNIGADAASNEIEQMRGSLSQALQVQNRMNVAVEQMDVEEVNAAYLELSSIVGNLERNIRDNVDEQGNFNQKLEQGQSSAEGLIRSIKSAVGAYLSIQTVGEIFSLSDQMTQTEARLNMIVDDNGSIEELQQKIYNSAQAARGNYQNTADAVSKFGLLAGEAFNNNDEIIAFAEQLNKHFTIAGTSQEGISSATLQLTQALGAGVLRGEELNSVFEQAPTVIQAIADYLDKPIGSIREMAADGLITSEIVKNAMFDAADQTNAKFETMPMTWEQVWTSMTNTALMEFQPVLDKINELANNAEFQQFVSGALGALSTVATVALSIMNAIGTVGGFIAENWSIIGPIVWGIVAALGAYVIALGIYNTVQAISNTQKAISIAQDAISNGMKLAEAAALKTATGAQIGLNTAMLACPVFWIIVGIIALIAILFAVCGAIAKTSDTANSAFGVMMGGIFVVGAWFKNLGLTIANFAIGVWNAICALCENFTIAFHNAISSVQAWFYDLLSDALTVIGEIAAALNKLPFVEIDVSGLTSAADTYAAKAAEAQANKQEYKSVSEAFNNGMSTFDTWQDGWASDAFASGAAWGDGVSDKVSGAVDNLKEKFDPSNLYEDVPGAEELAQIADDTGSIKDSVSISEEDLKYLRDIAEQETINRFTTAAITIQQTNNNNVSSDVDIDGFVDNLTTAVDEAMFVMAEGVHA